MGHEEYSAILIQRASTGPTRPRKYSIGNGSGWSARFLRSKHILMILLSDDIWIQYGKTMMTISGLACLAFALNTSLAPANWLLKVWVGAFGILNVYVALVSRAPSDKETPNDQ